MFTYPHTIDNGLGERLTFLRRVATAEGEALEVENAVTPGQGPPMHVHWYQEEALTVVSGKIGYQVKGREAQFGGAGDTVVFKPGVSHRFWNAGTDELRCSGYIRPPDSIEYFLKGIFDAQRKSGRSRPDPFDSAYLISRYRSEFHMDEIPALVQRVVLPAQVFMGHLLGKYHKFSDAPPPVQRRNGGAPG